MRDAEAPNPCPDAPAGDEVLQAEDVAVSHARHDDVLWQLRTLVEGIPQLVWRSCDLGRWTWASPQWLSFTGQTQEQSHGLGWMDTVHPEDRPIVSAAWAEARPHGERSPRAALRFRHGWIVQSRIERQR